MLREGRWSNALQGFDHFPEFSRIIATLGQIPQIKGGLGLFLPCKYNHSYPSVSSATQCSVSFQNSLTRFFVWKPWVTSIFWPDPLRLELQLLSAANIAHHLPRLSAASQLHKLYPCCIWLQLSWKQNIKKKKKKMAWKNLELQVLTDEVKRLLKVRGRGRSRCSSVRVEAVAGAGAVKKTRPES